MDKEILCKEIEDLFHKSKGRYGRPKVVAELKSMGLHASRPRVDRTLFQKLYHIKSRRHIMLLMPDKLCVKKVLFCK
ncbi:IS3 family transposase [Chitinophaga qingshengii]|uniref:Transposase n=1 Tax=Chitinophaga qingshengii TaxID=1569794 RepID=A0ABR7TPB0_9BACT|nr:transposase [Chitinophaga qingshengii]